MGLFDNILNGATGGGIYGGLPAAWQYPPSPADVKDPRAKAYLESQVIGDAVQVPQLSDAFATPPSRWMRFFGFDTSPQNQPAVPFMANGAPITGQFDSINPQSLAAPQTAPQGGPFPPVSFAPPQQPQAAAPAPQPELPAIPSDASGAMRVGNVMMPQFGQPTPSSPILPQSAQAVQYEPPPSPGFGDRLSAAGQGFLANAHTGPIGALLGGLGAGVTGRAPITAGGTLSAQYKALVPLLGEQRAMLAVMSPEAGKILLAQALEKKNYGFHTMPDGTVIRTDPQTGKAELAYGDNTSDTITGPDGKPIQVPPGVDRKTFINEVSRANAKAAAGEKTEVQAKSEIFANKMESAEKTIKQLEGQGQSLWGKMTSGTTLGNYAQSPEYQKYRAASSNFITALLRQESGAAISKSEFERYEKEYMPQPGDSPEVLAQKSEMRRVAIEGMKKGAGPGYKSPTAGNGNTTKTGVTWSIER